MPDPKVSKVQEGQSAAPGLEALLVQLEPLVLPVQLEQLEPLAPKVIKVTPELRVSRALPATLAHKVQKVTPEMLGQLVLKVKQAQRGHRVLKERLERLVPRDYKGRQVQPGYRAYRAK